jgi:methionyl aminopeptidase
MRTLADGWTVVTADGTLPAQFEHSVIVTRDGCGLTTRWPA